MKHKKRTASFPLELNESDYCHASGKKKRKYPTEFDAELSAPVRTLSQYVCEYCGYWHNGKGNQEKMDKIPPRS